MTGTKTPGVSARAVIAAALAALALPQAGLAPAWARDTKVFDEGVSMLQDATDPLSQVGLTIAIVAFVAYAIIMIATGRFNGGRLAMAAGGVFLIGVAEYAVNFIAGK